MTTDPSTTNSSASTPSPSSPLSQGASGRAEAPLTEKAQRCGPLKASLWPAMAVLPGTALAAVSLLAVRSGGAAEAYAGKASDRNGIALVSVAAWAYLIPTLYAEYAWFRLARERRQHRRNKNDDDRNNHRKESDCIPTKEDDCESDSALVAERTSLDAVCMEGKPSGAETSRRRRASDRWWFWVVLAAGLGIYLGTAALVCHYAEGMDRRAEGIVEGASGVAVAAIALALGVSLCQWLGVYGVRNAGGAGCSPFSRCGLATALWNRGLRFSSPLFWCHSYCCCSQSFPAVAFGTAAGVLVGTLWAGTVGEVYRRSSGTGLASAAALVSGGLTAVSAACFGAGAYGMALVWTEDPSQIGNEAFEADRGSLLSGIALYSSLAWGLVVCGGLHGGCSALAARKCKRKSKHKSSHDESSDDDYDDYACECFTPDHFRERLVLPEKGFLAGGTSERLPPLGSTQRTYRSVRDDSDGYHSGSIAGGSNHRLGKSVDPEGKSAGSDTSSSRSENESESESENDGPPGEEDRGPSRGPVRPSCGWRLGAACFGTASFLLSCLFLYLTVMNLGATYQQNIVRLRLNDSFAILYPDDYHTGEMCAWSDRSPEGELRTFASLREVEETNGAFTVVHCGACGACSNWEDLSLQWTTRTFLAQASKQCCRTSILGSVEDVQECNEELIGFTPECAACWTTDELCARDNCFWIFLQATTTNAETDFRVGVDDITAASCDEAMCGPDFAPCVGAIRRRMNIKSDIERPISQQCTPVQEDWSAIFD
ncbi:unnamed protein product [Pseudo-nitzschia multistriata]|uniref:Uncharacterized protein n=1 Tax=Pseudo-nitzschia multistriata TaxID=183589 RepID=A0A448ZPI0_9STRA|nr:unnamed protein product [Pseudo-nitzschia multistriata]